MADERGVLKERRGKGEGVMVARFRSGFFYLEVNRHLTNWQSLGGHEHELRIIVVIE